MSFAAQPLPGEDSALSPWWLRTVLIVMVLGFAGLIAITSLAYRNAPPIPAQVLDAQAVRLFTGDDISAGQAIFLKYGLMNNGSIWGHGAYLGPDYSAEALHRIGEDTATVIAQQQYQQPLSALTPGQLAAVYAQTAVELKTNRYDAASATLHLTMPETAAYHRQITYWTDYFLDPARNGGLKRGLIRDPTELQQFSAFVTWTAWASVANRPGENYSYTNNFPYDPHVGNTPIPDALLFLAQTLVGGAAAHYRAEPGSFYGFQLERLFPSNLMRTWHLQTAVFWIAIAYVAAALFLGRSLRNDEPRWFASWVHLLFGAFVVVIGGSLLGEWAGISQMLGHWWFWLGNQGWEYLELGRLWQYLLIVGLLVWFAILLKLVQPDTLSEPAAKTFGQGCFLLASPGDPDVSTCRRFSLAPRPHFTVGRYLGASGSFIYGSKVFFEFFVTTMVALMFFINWGLTRRNVALRVIYLDAIPLLIAYIKGWLVVYRQPTGLTFFPFNAIQRCVDSFYQAF
jgi:nitric oxide reductase subunit B